MSSTQEDFRPEPQSARAVRSFVAEAASGARHLDDIVLAASELASNVIRHAKTEFTVRITNANGRIRLEVADGSSIIPAVQELSGPRRGLRMLETLADGWGVDATDDGKVVWAEFDAT